MRALVIALSLVAVLGCKKEEAKPSTEREQRKADKASGKAEVEFVGTLNVGELKPAKLLFVAQAEPCTPVPEKPTRFGEAAVKPGSLFAEFFIPQGTKGHACVYGYDEAGALIGVANSTQNPMTFEGKGEVIFAKLEYTLTAP